MNARSILQHLALVAVTALCITAPALAADRVPFNATLSGPFVAFPCPDDPTVNCLQGVLYGQSTHLGKTIVPFQGRSTVPGIVDGMSQWISARGDGFSTRWHYQRTSLTPTIIYYRRQSWIISGSGTGRFAGVTGEFESAGWIDRATNTKHETCEGWISSVE